MVMAWFRLTKRSRMTILEKLGLSKREAWELSGARKISWLPVELRWYIREMQNKIKLRKENSFERATD